MPSFLDLLPEKGRELALERARKRRERNSARKGLDVAPEIYMVAEFGYYFGWDAVVAIKRGYIEKIGSKGEIIKEPFTLDEVMILLEAARKVWYSKLTEQTHSTMVGNSFKTAATSFDQAVKPFTERAEVTE